MSEPQLTSIIMVSYFTGPVLEKAIAAVLAQTATVELILVNNGNPPAIETAFLERFKDDPSVRYLTGHGNIGFGRACNLGARMARGDRILFLNPDSLLPPEAITTLYKQEKGLKRPFILGARLLDGEGKDQRGCRRALLTPQTAFIEALGLSTFLPKMRLNYHQEPLPRERTPMPAISGAFMYMIKEDFLHLGGFDEDYFLHVEDLDLCLRLSRKGGKAYFIPDLVVTHMGGTSKTTNQFLELNKAKGFIRYFHKNFEGFYPHPLLWLLDVAIWARYGLNVYLLPHLKALRPKSSEHKAG